MAPWYTLWLLPAVAIYQIAISGFFQPELSGDLVSILVDGIFVPTFQHGVRLLILSYVGLLLVGLPLFFFFSYFGGERRGMFVIGFMMPGLFFLLTTLATRQAMGDTQLDLESGWLFDVISGAYFMIAGYLMSSKFWDLSRSASQ